MDEGPSAGLPRTMASCPKSGAFGFRGIQESASAGVIVMPTVGALAGTSETAGAGDSAGGTGLEAQAKRSVVRIMGAPV